MKFTIRVTKDDIAKGKWLVEVRNENVLVGIPARNLTRKDAEWVAPIIQYACNYAALELLRQIARTRVNVERELEEESDGG